MSAGDVEPGVRALGEHGLLLELGGTDDVLAVAAAAVELVAARRGPWALVAEVVPGASTLLLRLRPGADRASVVRAARSLGAAAARVPVSAARVVEVPVRYEGPDLAEVARHTGLTVAEVVEAHTASTWRVGFTGFAPGFAYLVGGDPRLVVPRRSEPRTRVPPGSVALAGPFSGVYPRASPGGWQLLGETDLALWDLSADPPATLRPGDAVRFVRVGAARTVGTRREAPSSATRGPATSREEPGSGGAARPDRLLEVLETGPLTLVQDLGRVGYASSGVSPSGAADRGAHRLGNRLVANAEGEASLEVLLGGLALRARCRVTVAVTGAPAVVTVAGRRVPHGAPVDVGVGDVLRIDPPHVGLRTYVAVRGGVAVAAVLGSRSTDVLSGLGPPPVRPGDLLPVGDAPRRLPHVDVAPQPGADASDGPVELAVVPGPRDDWFADAQALADEAWTVTDRSDRVGIRLDGTPLRRREAYATAELPSEAAVRGAIQVPPDGRPVLLLSDHPVTGGYPVIGVVTEEDVDRAAQVRPGERVRFRWRR